MKSVDLWRKLCASLLYIVVRDYVYDFVVKKFTFAISSADELLVYSCIHIRITNA